MANPFKSIPIYIKLYVNEVEITRLDTGQTVSQIASRNISNDRLVVADFQETEILLKRVLSCLIPKKIFMPQLNIIIHQLDYITGGLSPTEKRILINVAKRIGGKNVIVEEDLNPLSFLHAKTKFKVE